MPQHEYGDFERCEEGLNYFSRRYDEFASLRLRRELALHSSAAAQTTHWTTCWQKILTS